MNASKPEYDWLAEEIKSSTVTVTADIKVRLDGFFPVEYRDAYMAAWRELMPRASELAFPLPYLQRHALELIIKDTIRSLLDARHEARLGYATFGLPAKKAVVDRASWKADWD
jgi:hypothetical protein